MAKRLEIALKKNLPDPSGHGLMRKAKDYFDIEFTDVRTVNILTMDIKLTDEQFERIRTGVFTNPITQISSYEPLNVPFDWQIWVGYRPGVRDTAGSTAVEAIEDLLDIKITGDEAVYTSKRYCFTGADLTYEKMDTIAAKLLANDIIQEWKIIAAADWNDSAGIGINVPKVILNHIPTVSMLKADSQETMMRISDERNLALNPADAPTIMNYFSDARVQKERAEVGLTDPTDVELEYISQARSDHCNHNTFGGLFRYKDLATGESKTIDSLFRTCIKEPTLQLQKQKDWVVSVLWDNAGAGKFDDDNYYVITGETHNSPSNMEAYGGSLTGIVGVYRDPLGTGLGARLIMGGYGFCVGDRDYGGSLQPRLHPRRLLDGVIEGVRDGGNKSGIPTTYGQVYFNHGYMGKCLVFVTAIGMMPKTIAGRPSELKETSPGELIIMSGGRVGKDGIHGVTASSEVFSAHTPAGHVQIGDPYTQKKMHDFLLEARDLNLIQYITDNGGGGLSSSVGESARFSGGCTVELEKVPLKYAGLDQWEIWISESQERMTISIKPEDLERFMALSRKHAVESTVIGRYTDSGKLEITYNGDTCAYVDIDLLTQGFPQWEFQAEWLPPSMRGLNEPVLTEPGDYETLLKDMLKRPNIASHEWIQRQYDHEVQGASVIKPLAGVNADVNSDAAVNKPVHTSWKGLAFAQALFPSYSAIDAHAMTAAAIDAAVRKLLAIGGSMEHIGGIDNYCWPNIQYDATSNPDGKFKAAQLVRSCECLRDLCLAYGIPLLSGKDSMYVDGYLAGPYGQAHKVSGPETLQFSTIGLIEDVRKCVSMDPKCPGDLIYLLGCTKNELGGSEYYRHLGYTGLNVPTVCPLETIPLYTALENAIQHELLASCHGIYHGGLGVHLALCAIASGMGMEIDLGCTCVLETMRDSALLFSETTGRFIVTINPENQAAFEAAFKDLPVNLIGRITENTKFIVKSTSGNTIINVDTDTLRKAWKEPFGGLI